MSEPTQDPIIIDSVAIDPERTPNLLRVNTTTLRVGPRRKRIVKYEAVRNQHTGSFHHDSVTIKTVKPKQEEWIVDEPRSVTLSSEDGFDELHRLVHFIQVSREGLMTQPTGRYVVATAPQESNDLNSLKEILRQLKSGGNYGIFAAALKQIGKDANLLDALIARAAKYPQLFMEAAAALNYATYRASIDRLQGVIADPDCTEQDFQSLLRDNPWMFGSEFSELLSRRRWKRDENQDFVVRCTTDGYLEIVEIKTPLSNVPLFRHDGSHDSYYPGAELSKVLGQVQKYLEILDADHDRIMTRDGEDTSKVRAKIIIGRNIDQNQVHALRRFNGHLHRIQVITFDQLLKIAERVVGYLDQTLHPIPDDGQ